MHTNRIKQFLGLCLLCALSLGACKKSGGEENQANSGKTPAKEAPRRSYSDKKLPSNFGKGTKALTPERTDVSEDGEPKLPEDFVTFYEQFHKDEEFQLQHIIFPLKGLPGAADAETIEKNNFYWQGDDWKMHHELVNPDNMFTQSFLMIDDKLIIDRIDLEGQGMGMERRFAKLDDDWYLIYYIAMNPMARRSNID